MGSGSVGPPCRSESCPGDSDHADPAMPHHWKEDCREAGVAAVSTGLVLSAVVRDNDDLNDD